MQARSVFTLAFLLGGAALAQKAASSTSQTISKPSSLMPPVSGAPYAAEEHRVRTRMLEDGTRITETWPVRKIFRDKDGRTRIDRPLLTSPNAPETPRVVEIDDAIAGFEYILEPAHKIAHRFMVPAGGRTLAATPDASTPDPDGSKAEVEDLGAWTIEGLRAEGVRRVVRISGAPMPADAIAVGDDSDRGLATVRETWTSPDLHVVLREKFFDPHLGQSVTELINLHTGEQAAALFQVPPEYRIVDEPGDFAISFVAKGPTSLPEVISKTPASYTDGARRRGIQGTVLLSAVIDESGKAQSIHVEQSVDPDLDQEAVKALHAWRFKPGTQGGHPVRVPVRVEITFRLDD